MIVTLEEAKIHLRVQHNEEDHYLETLIAQVQVAAEDYCRVSFEDPAPEPVRLALLLMISYYYENRESTDNVAYSTMMRAFHSLLYPYRDPDKMF